MISGSTPVTALFSLSRVRPWELRIFRKARRPCCNETSKFTRVLWQGSLLTNLEPWEAGCGEGVMWVKVGVGCVFEGKITHLPLTGLLFIIIVGSMPEVYIIGLLVFFWEATVPLSTTAKCRCTILEKAKFGTQNNCACQTGVPPRNMSKRTSLVDVQNRIQGTPQISENMCKPTVNVWRFTIFDVLALGVYSFY